MGAALSKTAANMLLAAAMQDGLAVQDYMLPGGGAGGSRRRHGRQLLPIAC